MALNINRLTHSPWKAELVFLLANSNFLNPLADFANNFSLFMMKLVRS